jgi:hypothetical protein
VQPVDAQLMVHTVATAVSFETSVPLQITRRHIPDYPTRRIIVINFGALYPVLFVLHINLHEGKFVSLLLVCLKQGLERGETNKIKPRSDLSTRPQKQAWEMEV